MQLHIRNLIMAAAAVTSGQPDTTRKKHQVHDSTVRKCTCLFIGHPQCVALECDTSAPALGRGRVETKEQRRVRREASCEKSGTLGSDVDQQLMLRLCEHFHVELLRQPRAKALSAVNLQAVLGLVGQGAVLWRIRRT